MPYHLQDYLHYITNQTNRYNLDNLKRTKAYQQYYSKFPEMKWVLLASFVSRNAGWNMTDLYHEPLHMLLGKKERLQLFLIYEKANWLIFSDAYPQLLVYQLSKKLKRPLFYLLPKWQVSEFMIAEWSHYWIHRDGERLLRSLIINEQQVIQKPIIENQEYHRSIFKNLPYMLQNSFKTNAVLLPTTKATIYGLWVRQFTKMDERILLGKQLASIIFHPHLYPEFHAFHRTVPHTGSRMDYEQFSIYRKTRSPNLRSVCPIITHQHVKRRDWYQDSMIKESWILPEKPFKIRSIGPTFYRKRQLIQHYQRLKQKFFRTSFKE